MATEAELQLAAQTNAANQAHQLEVINRQNAHTLLMQEKTAYLAYIQMASNLLMQNKASLPVSERTITPEEIVAFADSLKAAASA